jgi:transcriptional regulator with XRE-family HTH domain
LNILERAKMNTSQITAYERIKKQLKEQPLSLGQVAEGTGFSEQTIRNWIKAMRSLKMVYVYDYAPGPNTASLVVPRYKLGDKADAKRAKQK